MTTIQSARQKGKELENFVADKLISYGIDKGAIRQIGSGSGKRKGDINTSCGWTIECKNQKSFNWKEAAAQVQKESMGYQKEVIIWHPPQKPLINSVAIINIEEFLHLVKFKIDHQNSDQILDKYEIKNNLEKAIFHLKQVIKNL